MLMNKKLSMFCLTTSASIIRISVPSPLCRISNLHVFKRWAENQRIMFLLIKRDF